MKLSELDQWLELLNAVKNEGRVLQYNGVCGWEDMAQTSNWSLENTISRYRLKPLTTIRPWNGIEEVPLNAVFRDKGGGHIYNYVTLTTEGIGVRSSFYIWIELHKLFDHTTDLGKTWRDCGVEITE